MSCPKRPYKLLGFINSFKDHVWEIEKVGVFMRWVCDEYTVIYRCPHCQLTQKRSFVSAEELMRKGYTVEELQELKGVEI